MVARPANPAPYGYTGYGVPRTQTQAETGVRYAPQYVRNEDGTYGVAHETYNPDPDRLYH